LGGVLGGVLILIGVGVLAVVEGFFFLGLILIKDLLATRRSSRRSSSRSATRRTSLTTSTRKRSNSSSNNSLICNISLSEQVIKLGYIMMCIQRKSQMPPNLIDGALVLMDILSNGLAHAKQTAESSLHKGVMVAMAGRGRDT